MSDQFDYEDDDDTEILVGILNDNPELIELDPSVILPPNTTSEVPEAWVDDGD